VGSTTKVELTTVADCQSSLQGLNGPGCSRQFVDGTHYAVSYAANCTRSFCLPISPFCVLSTLVHDCRRDCWKLEPGFFVTDQMAFLFSLLSVSGIKALALQKSIKQSTEFL